MKIFYKMIAILIILMIACIVCSCKSDNKPNASKIISITEIIQNVEYTTIGGNACMILHFADGSVQPFLYIYKERIWLKKMNIIQYKKTGDLEGNYNTIISIKVIESDLKPEKE